MSLLYYCATTVVQVQVQVQVQVNFLKKNIIFFTIVKKMICFDEAFMEREYNGERVKIRKLKFSDADDIYEHIHEREISKWTIHIPYPYEPKDAIKFIRKSLYEMRKKKGYNFVVVLKESDKVIGGVGLNRIDWKNEFAELGYWIGKKYWGKRLMTEAVRLILDFGFGELKLHRIHANVFEENIASKRVLEKCGFTLEGMEREIEFRYDKWHNVLLYGILTSEYHE